MAQISLRDAQIYLFIMDVDPEIAAVATAAIEASGVRVIAMQGKNLFGAINLADFNKTHVPLTTLARFFIEPSLPEGVTDVLYIDGDTLVTTPAIQALIETPVPEGRFLAAEDISSFCRNDISPHGSRVREYFSGIGVAADQGYFNAGVFKAARPTWKLIADEAFRYFLANTRACRYHDQSALNAVVKDRRLVLSTKFNFQTPYVNWGLEERVAPALYHFTQSIKPWMGDCPPWAKFYPHYHALEAERLRLKLPLKTLSPEDVVRVRKEQNDAALSLHSIMLPRLLNRRQKFRAIESQAFVK